MNRPYFSLFVVAIFTWSALRGAGDLPVIADGQVLTALLRAVLLVAGVLALRALWQGRRDAARVTAVWALLALGLVVAQDIAVGYTRAYLAAACSRRRCWRSSSVARPGVHVAHANARDTERAAATGVRQSTAGWIVAARHDGARLSDRATRVRRRGVLVSVDGGCIAQA